jgi:hypothetical protein
MDSQKLVGNSDKIGVITSVLCIIHCAFLPVFITLITGFSEFFAAYFHEIFIDVAFLAIAFIAVFISAKNTNLIPIKIAFWVSYLVFSIGIFLVHSYSFSALVAFLGSAGLIITHIFNFKLSRKPANQ